MNHPFDFPTLAATDNPLAEHATGVNPLAHALSEGAINPALAPAPGVAPVADPMAGSGYSAQGWPHNSAGYGSQLAAPTMQRTREMTIDELLLENRVIFLVGEINYASATGIIMRLLYLQSQKKKVDINLYINSHGGGVDDTLAIFDTIAYLDCDVATYCIGRAYSGAALVLAAGAKGKRFALPHAQVMIHQPFGGVTGQASDIKIQAEDILKKKAILNQIVSDKTGKPLEQVEQDSERDKYFTAAEAAEYGLVDEVLGKPKDDKSEDKPSESK
jgi:ATP-dependent Clp protease, protease subunit